MRRIAIIIATAALVALAVSPAAADPITPSQAVTELTASVSATNAADSCTYSNTYSDLRMSETASFSASAGQYEQQGFETFKTFNGVGTYYRIRWPSEAVREKVLGPRYLNNPALQWELITGRIGALEVPLWPDLVDLNGDRLGGIYFSPIASDIAYADKTAVAEGTRYVIGNSFYEDVYTVDPSGRVTRLETTRAAGASVTGRVKTWAYVPVSIPAPTADTFLPYASVHTRGSKPPP